MGEALIDVFRRRQDGGAYWKSIGGTWHMPIGTILILRLSANNIRTAGSIGMGKTLINVTNRFDVWVSQLLLPFASDAKSVTLLQFNERDSKAVAGVFRISMVSMSSGVDHARRTCNLQRHLWRETNFIIEITNMYIYDFGPKAMLSNVGL